jgi:hypothetical protein
LVLQLKDILSPLRFWLKSSARSASIASLSRVKLTTLAKLGRVAGRQGIGREQTPCPSVRNSKFDWWKRERESVARLGDDTSAKLFSGFGEAVHAKRL